MGVLGDLGRLAWRLWRTDGVPSSGPQEPLKADILAFVDAVDQAVVWVRRTGSFSVVAFDLSDVDTSDAPATATLPADLAEGDRFGFNDFAGTWGTNALTIDPNGNEFEDLGDGSDPTEPMTCDATAQFAVVFSDGKLRIR